VRRRGAEEAGAVFVKVATLDGNAVLYASRCRPSMTTAGRSSACLPTRCSWCRRRRKSIGKGNPLIRCLIVETEDRAGRHFLDLARS
jgi:hypothetical protein